MAFGQEENTGSINLPGTWQDPESGKELTVVHNAAADALARMGWKRVAGGEDEVDPNLTPAMAADKAEKAKAQAKVAKEETK